MNDKSQWIDDDVSIASRIVAGVAAIAFLLYSAFFGPPYLGYGIARILVYAFILIAIVQFGELVWRWIKPGERPN